MILQHWKVFFRQRSKIYETVFSLFALAVLLILYTHFLNYVESRSGFSFDDPILRLFRPIDLTWLIFGLIYISLAAGIFYLAKDPNKFLLAVQLYSLIVIVRIIAMFLLPLNPPENIIILSDPLVEFFGSGKTLTKDLFFSGHTATLFMLGLVTAGRTRIIFYTAAFLIAVSLLLQHVHYSIDVFASIIFVYAVYKFYSSIRKSK